MPVAVQVSIVVATIAFVAIAIAVIRAIGRLERAVDRISTTAAAISEVVTDVKAVTDEAHEIVAGFRTVLKPVQRTANGFENLGQRVLGLSNAVFDEIAAPVGMVAAVVRGVRTGAGTLLSRLTQRTAHYPNGGHES